MRVLKYLLILLAGLTPLQMLMAAVGESEAMRMHMLEAQLKARDITDSAVLAAMAAVARQEFVADTLKEYAYQDSPLPIAQGQTISQPYIVAYMTQALDLKANDKVLEVGTGSGYQAAVLAEIVNQVYTIEIIAELAATAKNRLQRLGYKNIHVRHGDGYIGWKEEAPFDAIIVTAGAEKIPAPLIEQLRVGGKLIMPVGGSGVQQLQLLTKVKNDKTSIEVVKLVRFVPLTRDADEQH